MIYNPKNNTARTTLLTLLVLLLGGIGVAVANINEYSATEAQALIAAHQGNPDFLILDIRTPAEFAQGHIAGAVSIDYYSPQFKSILDRLDRGKTYLVYCRSGNRSKKALKIFDELGFTQIYHLSGGILDWTAKAYKLVPVS
ncbi:MAG: rhodanese-like domain-containing protein [Desulfobacterales bacterium]|nr:rhodanese-like domain-containing protein [Desulfobacterales bacterium]